MSTLVMKFGGTSLGSEYALKRAGDIVSGQIGEWDQIVVVVSAMQGVTDMLLACAEIALAGDQDQFQNIAGELHHKLTSTAGKMLAGEAQLGKLIETHIAELNHICQRIQDQGAASPGNLAQIAALGERINIHFFSAVLQNHGLSSEPIDAAKLIITDGCFQSATPIKELTDTRIKEYLSPLLAGGTIPVVTGFIGATLSGETTTLGRGGSDYTAAILAESLGADEIWIWTDVDGVMTADPALVPSARLIPEISYSEVFQLAYSGAAVLHPKTMLPAREANIPLYVKNTFNSKCGGTRVSHCSSSVRHTISAVTGHFDIKTITLKLKPGEDIYHIKSLILTVLKNQGIPALAVFQADHNRSICFAVPANNVEQAIQIIRESWTDKSSGRTYPQENGDLSLITIVGREIYLYPHVLSEVSNTLDNAGIEIKRIGNGNSPDAVVLAVEARLGYIAIQQIHDRLVLNGNSPTSQMEPILRHQPAI